VLKPNVEVSGKVVKPGVSTFASKHSSEGLMKSKLKEVVKLQQESLADTKIATMHDALGNLDNAVDFHIQALTKDEMAQQILASYRAPSIVAGEFVPSESECPDNQGGWVIRNTLASPDIASLQASMERTNLLSQGHTDVLALGIDAAQSATCETSLEKMLAHQMALAHQTAFKVIDEAMQQRNPVEMARLLNAGTRLMAAYQNGMLALHRIKNGGNQVVTVQHVTVNGGQAVVAGNLQPGEVPQRRGDGK
jgi:hypothetical protein